VVLQSGCVGGVLVLNCSSQLLSAAYAVSEEGVRATGGRRDEGEVHTWGGAKADRVGVKSDGAGCAGVRTRASIQMSGR
jgi:hypothetical protein